MKRLLFTLTLPLLSMIPHRAEAHPAQYYTRYLSVSAYAPGCGASGRMASGSWPFVGAAAGPYRFGTRAFVPGFGRVRVLDRGVPYGFLDLFVATCTEAWQWGRRELPVRIYYR